MKYTKTYEGFFDRLKTDIPKGLIDSVVGNLSKDYKVTVEHPKSKKENLLDRVKISCQTKIGNVDLVISLLKTKGMFKENQLHVSSYYGKERYVYSTISMSEIDYNTGELKAIAGREPIQNVMYGYPNNISKYVEYTINKVIKSNKAKKEFEDFYKKELIEEVKDLLIDLYDMLGEYKMEKKTVKGRKGFFVEFKSVPDELRHVVHTRSNGASEQVYFEPSEKHMRLLSEIHNLYMRLKDGYGLTLDYNIHSGVKLVILQNEIHKGV